MITKSQKLRAKSLVISLCNWFAASKRDLPWRRTRDPYRVWLSEIMLQQTQVATVIPYYERFLSKFPTVQALAAAPLDDVLKLWAGLGYYSRARNLHRGAAMIVARFGGRIPDTPEAIREIPGIGAYTAGAILSIAYGKAEPLVDGNVARVLSRLLLIKGDWRKGAAKEQLWAVAHDLVVQASSLQISVGDLNEALMELGATICTPSSTPACLLCPIAAHCQARIRGVQAQYPEAIEKAAVPTWKLRAWLVEDKRGRILLARREESGLFGGLWEVPTERIVKSTNETPPKAIGRVAHVLTHRRLAIQVCRMDAEAKPERWNNAAEFPCWSGSYMKYQWIKPGEAVNGAVGLASVQHKIIALASRFVALASRQ